VSLLLEGKKKGEVALTWNEVSCFPGFGRERKTGASNTGAENLPKTSEEGERKGKGGADHFPEGGKSQSCGEQREKGGLLGAKGKGGVVPRKSKKKKKKRTETTRENGLSSTSLRKEGGIIIRKRGKNHGLWSQKEGKARRRRRPALKTYESPPALGRSGHG